MTDNDKKFLDRINQYAEEVLKDIDPQKTPISFQLEKLKPIMETLSKELDIPVDDIFIKYMDLASEASLDAHNKLKEDLGPDLDIEIR